MTGSGARRRVLPAAPPAVLVAVLLVIVQFFAHGINEPASSAEFRTQPATAPYAQCGDDTHPDQTSERFRARGRPHCRGLVSDTAPRLHARTVTTADDSTPVCCPAAVAHQGTRPPGREPTALLQVFRC
ncbi:hypothetical protein ACFVXC_02025 [Streptomyces sp. NPDC058257]|uniref:hypothetical protein n=1 Tax=Streptomyces sp. NPDC058257 TaxID=3346409 RepID=UPI0036F01EA1